ncbi:glutaredoxin family protein [Halobacillus sp. ACCC02827]|uniref:glutaredoxin family protein n=1 Tax=Bacillaceae TaxID=186817 RepID=UPI0002A5156B|nr:MULTISPECIES: glutaredoxin family protein [Bacillaceae]ELK47987.1 glutaredoxin [Halobacillus sp. BAB-2008]WJE14835.1 glutaredoxin family protein [Halobacillus sp. ACCC02827]
MKEVVLYSRPGCKLCEEVKQLIELFDAHVLEVNIEDNPDLLEKYILEIPVVDISGETLDYRSIDYFQLEKRLQ